MDATLSPDRSLNESLVDLEDSTATEQPLDDLSQPNSYRLAFTDPEFLARREARGIRFQLELLKPDLGQAEFGIDHTVVVYGSARFVDPEMAAQRLLEAKASGDIKRIAAAEQGVRNARRYDQARAFAHLVAEHLSLIHI